MKMNNIPSVSAVHFTYRSNTRTFTAFESDLRGILSGPVRIYDDACDVGFYVVGRPLPVLFVESNIKRNADGDIQCWEYSALSSENPADLRDIKLVIYND